MKMPPFKTALLTLFLIGLSACVDDPKQAQNKSQNSTASLNQFYDKLPDIGSCDAGELKQAEKLKVLAELNKIRQLHHLPAVDYEYNDDVYTAGSALISVANSKLSHHPTPDFKCYSEDGALGSSKSNLQIFWRWDLKNPPESSAAVVSWLIDDTVESLGHRRWLLDPSLKYVSFGRVDGKPLVQSKYPYVNAMSLKVINNQKAQLDHLDIDFVAYPFGNYPRKYFKNGWYMSFAVLADQKQSNADVDFSKAKINIIDSHNARPLKVVNIKYNNEGFGWRNHLQWQAKGIEMGKKYTVTIDNVIGDAAAKPQTYQYDFKLIE